MMLSLDKREIVQRQLTTAIELYFQNGDPVAIHTLVHASYGILKGLNDVAGGKPMILEFDFLDEGNFEEKKLKKYAIKAVNKAGNFFKHADRDADETIVFKPKVNEILLWEACEKYQELFEVFPLMLVYRGWFYTWFEGGKEKYTPAQLKVSEENAARYTIDERTRYYNDHLEVSQEVVEMVKGKTIM